jgi:RNA polymerase sigma-70 factor (ECF subfamily)
MINCEQKEGRMEAALIKESNRVNAARHTANSVERSDETLVAAAKGGSRPAFEELIERYHKRLFRVARSLAESREDAEEITQDAFVQAFKNLSRFRGDSRFYTWLVRITINTGLMKLRGHRAQVISIDDKVGNEAGFPPRELVDSGATPERSYLQRELQKILVTSIGQLPSGYRSVFTLRAVQGFSTEETAHALDLSLPAVKSRLRRARLQGRQSLTQHFKAAHGKPGYFVRTYSADSRLPGCRHSGFSKESTNTTSRVSSESSFDSSFNLMDTLGDNARVT